MLHALRAALACAAFALLAAVPVHAQVFTRPHLDWRTLRTEHFDVHYPAEMSAWTLDVARRMESAHEAVAALVGFAPTARTTVLVEDPSAVANGFAYSFLDGPVIVLWPTPPDPRSNIGNHRGAGEQLIVHEFAHVAHLTRPSRNPRARLLSTLLPVEVGPVVTKSPRWLREGYATYVEGRVTGSGRPHSVVRAAILRQWALEGRLPIYGQLDASGAFQGGSFAYHMGSGFLEWLADRRGLGDSTLVHLSRRMSARQERGFADAFAGVFGGPPTELYGLFLTDVVERATEARDRLSAAGLVTGDTVQRLAWGTGDPAVSPSGEHLAVVLRGAPTVPARLVVWRTDEPGPDTAAAVAARRLREADPEDVPDIRWRPRPKRQLASLVAREGRAWEHPRFLPGGEEILLVRPEPRGDGTLRPDLWTWRWRDGSLRRVTHGAGLHAADPAPDGRRAAAVQCRGGVCSLVTVDLASGEVRALAEGAPETVFYRPRWSPDGGTIAVGVQSGGLWRVMLADAETGALRQAGPEDGWSRYDAAWTPDGRALLATSERGGVANLERIDVATGEVAPLTRVTGAAVAPEVHAPSGDVLYLSLHATGWDLNRLPAGGPRPDSVVFLTEELAPVAPRRPTAGQTLAVAETPPSRGYGTGPRRYRPLPYGWADADGGGAGILLLSTDPVGRLSWALRGTHGEDSAQPRGAALWGVWRGMRTHVGGELFAARRAPGSVDAAPPGAPSTEATYAGGALFAERADVTGALRQTGRLGASLGHLARGDGDGPSGGRALAYGEYSAGASASRGGRSVGGALALHAAAGRTDGEAWRRGIARGALTMALGRLNARADALHARVNEDAPAWEALRLGGTPEPLLSEPLLSQRVAFPALRNATARGTALTTWRASTRLRGVEAYHWWGRMEDDPAGWRRVLGVETTVGFAGGTVLRMPTISLLAGAARMMSGPDDGDYRAYVSLQYRP